MICILYFLFYTDVMKKKIQVHIPIDSRNTLQEIYFH